MDCHHITVVHAHKAAGESLFGRMCNFEQIIADHICLAIEIVQHFLMFLLVKEERVVMVDALLHRREAFAGIETVLPLMEYFRHRRPDIRPLVKGVHMPFRVYSPAGTHGNHAIAPGP